MNILLVSDIHLSINNIKRVRNDLNTKIDHVILSGDMCNLKGDDYTNESALRQSESDITEMINELKLISPSVYFIPGNHDPLTTFSNQGVNIGVNIHNEVKPLENGLLIAGFGGSVPAFDDSNVLTWQGYPCKTEEEYSNQLTPFMNSILTQKKTDNKKILLVTHVGPHESDTVKVRRRRSSEEEDQNSSSFSIIYSGSKTLQKQLERNEFQESVVLNVHGHTHDSKGSTMLYNIPVVNAGSLREGNYGIVRLERSDPNVEHSWFVQNVQLLHFHVSDDL